MIVGLSNRSGIVDGGRKGGLCTAASGLMCYFPKRMKGIPDKKAIKQMIHIVQWNLAICIWNKIA